VLNELTPVFSEALPLSLEEVFISEMEAAGYDLNKILS
jgi:ABC-2 type transport system ATP-binding protein